MEHVTLPPKYKPSESEEYMNANQLAYFQKKLFAWRQELEQELVSALDDWKETNTPASDEADRATNETEQFAGLKMEERTRKALDEIAAALVRIEEGTYGYCEETGEPIGLKRLDAMPTSTLSIEAQERREREEQTYADM